MQWIHSSTNNLIEIKYDVENKLIILKINTILKSDNYIIMDTYLNNITTIGGIKYKIRIRGRSII